MAIPLLLTSAGIRKNLELMAWFSEVEGVFFTFVGPTGTIIRLTDKEMHRVIDLVRMAKIRKGRKN